MSHLRAPAARADRREGGRHGRPTARTAPASAETHIRPQLLRLAVLPPTAVALSATAVLLFAVRAEGVQPDPVLWAVLAGAVAVTGAGIATAAVAADRAARSVSDRIAALRRNSARGEADLRALIEGLRRGEAPPEQRRSRGGPPRDADDFELLAADLAKAHEGAVTAVVQASRLSSQVGNEQKLEVFVNLARRLQSLVHREISILDELENEIEDPELLKGLFHVDHLATRIRRHAENLAVLGGAVSRRQWSNPVCMTEVLRSAIAEVEQYSRVRLVPPIAGELRGHAVADVIHLLAELVENATVFSSPHTQVLLRANLVTSGLAVEVEDRGLGMPVDEQSRMNALLADPDQVNVGRLLADGRIGLFVVSQLARRHGIRVRLQSNIYGGVQAVIVVPQALLGSAPDALGVVPQNTASTAGRGTPAFQPQPQSHHARPADTPAQGAPIAQAPGPTGEGTRYDRPSSPARARDHSPTRSPGHRRRTPEPPDVSRSPRPPADTGRRHTAPADPPAAPSRLRPATSPRDGRPAEPRVNGRTQAPLPVRGAQAARATPAEAVPGIRPQDRAAVEEHAGLAPIPRGGAVVRGTMGKPLLPRRRAQEHIAPQLRGGPAPRPDAEQQSAGHDPGLMAAFQRGIGLAEAQQSLETEILRTPDLERSASEMSALETTSALGTPEVSLPQTPAHQPSLPQPSALEHSLLDASARYASAPHPSLSEPSAPHPSPLETSLPQSSAPQPSLLETSALGTAALRPSPLEASAREADALETSALETSALEVSALDASLLEASASEAQARGASVRDGSASYPEWEALERSSYPLSDPFDPAAPPVPAARAARIPQAPPGPQQAGGTAPVTPDHPPTPRHDGSASAG